MAKPKKSFYDWCIENNHEDWLELWDYMLNGLSPKEIAYASNKKYYFKCPRGIHKSELKQINNLIKRKKIICNQCESFGQWLIDIYGKDALERYWDYEKNTKNPFEISKCSREKVWIFCQKNSQHNSYEITCAKFYNDRRCPYCASKRILPEDSFGQILVDEYESLEIIWDYEKNGDLNPFSLAKQSNKKVWLFCQEKEYHGSYKVKCEHHYSGARCPYCCNHHGKVHPKDSFGQKLIDDYGKNAIERLWSRKNGDLDPFTLSPYSEKKVWMICQKNEEHKDYEIKCHHFTNGNRCKVCNESKGERKIREILNTYNINFIPQKEFLGLVGTSEWKPLSYDFYIPSLNLLIEYQGQYHDGTAKNQTKEQFLNQQEHDRRKKEYAKLHNIKLLEIWYWDFNNIEEILNKNVK